MEKILRNPGLQHLVENIFWNLDTEELKICAQINQSCKQILEDPKFWLKKFENLSNENQKDWIKVIQSAKNSDKRIAIICYLQWNLKKDALVNLPCYSSPAVQDEILEICMNEESSDEDMKTIKILAPLVDNSNNPDVFGKTPIYWAALYGHTDIVKVLAPLTDDPNAPDIYGNTPIHQAACWGYTEIAKTLATTTNYPNAPNDHNGNTPIHEAVKKGHTEIVKVLAPLTNNPNVTNKIGKTPIFEAAQCGYSDIVKILAPLTDNPNAPSYDGSTPIYLAAFGGYTEIVKILAPLSHNPNAPVNGRTPSSVTKNWLIQKFLESFNTSRNFNAGSSKKALHFLLI